MPGARLGRIGALPQREGMQREEGRSMRINRTFLYAGVFLVAVGAIVAIANANLVGTPWLADAVRLWPLAVIAIGVALVVRRTRFSFAGGMLAAALPGVVLGSAFAIVPRIAGSCGAQVEPAITSVDQGAFVGPANIRVEPGCGTFNLNTAPGNGWQLRSGNSAARTPTIDAFGGELLAIETTTRGGWRSLEGSRDRWELTIPAGDVETLTLDLNASRSHIDLTGAQVTNLDLDANASDVVLDLGRASVVDFSAQVNTGVLSIRLPAGSDLFGSVHVNAGEIQICAPPEAGLLVQTSGSAYDVVAEGRRLGRGDYQSTAYATAAFHIDISLVANFASVVINPIGGCR